MTEQEIIEKLKTEQGFDELLGKPQGIAVRYTGTGDVPQQLFEYGFIENRVITSGNNRRPYRRVIFDRGELEGIAVDI